MPAPPPPPPPPVLPGGRRVPALDWGPRYWDGTARESVPPPDKPLHAT